MIDGQATATTKQRLRERERKKERRETEREREKERKREREKKESREREEKEKERKRTERERHYRLIYYLPGRVIILLLIRVRFHIGLLPSRHLLPKRRKRRLRERIDNKAEAEEFGLKIRIRYLS